MVNACWENMIEVSRDGQTWLPVANAETFDLLAEVGKETWVPIGGTGWQEAFSTTKALKAALTAKRTVGDEGNDLIASLFGKSGNDAYLYIRVNYPSGLKISCKFSVVVTNIGTGAGTGMAGLQADGDSCGAPTFEDPEATE